MTRMTMAQQQFAARRFFGGKKGDTARQYLEQEVKQWSSEKLILKTYDLFIVACKKGDVVKMNRVLSSLINALNFEYQEQSTRLYRMYEYCQTLVSQKRYDEVLKIIQEMRDAWAEAFKLR